MDRGRSFDDPQGAIRKAKGRHRRIFDFNPRMSQHRGMGCHGRHWPHQPQQKVNRMNRLIHQRASSVQMPGATPGPLIVVSLGTKPFNVGIPQRQPPETSLVDSSF